MNIHYLRPENSERFSLIFGIGILGGSTIRTIYVGILYPGITIDGATPRRKIKQKCTITLYTSLNSTTQLLLEYNLMVNFAD